MIMLALLALLVCVVSLVLLVVRAVRKKPKKPVAIAAAVSAVAFLVLVMAAPSNQTDVEPSAAPSESQTADAEQSAAPSAPAPDETAAPETEPPVAPSESQPAETEQSVEDVPFVERYKSDIVVASAMTIEKFTDAYKFSLAPQLWTVAAFDDVGAVCAMVSGENQNTRQSENLFVVFTPVMDGEKMTGSNGHYVLAGDSVLFDDGYCDDVLSVLQGLGQNGD